MTKEKIEDIHPMTQITIASIIQVCVLALMFLSMFFINIAFADEMVHKFKSPSFNGNNTSSHYLTIENQEFNRKMTIKEELKALQEQIKRDKENTTLARFIRNLESRIYAQLSRQLVENLFGENPSTEGTIELEGNTISYTSDGDIITLTITDADGNVTVIQLPIGSFTF
tara:strand:+ start:841 stop:1350 length:510 start_codon:yes stop_codon:yes gene_type:complete